MNTESKSPKIIALSSRWGSEFGGINSFNADLLAAVGVTFEGRIRILSVVLKADEEQISKAAQYHVEVITLGRPETRHFDVQLLPYIEDALKRSNCEVDSDTVWLGHDRITGDAAVAAAKRFRGRSALIHHMSYGQYEAYAEGAEAATAKEELQRAIFSDGDVLFAIGPILRNSLQDMVEKEVVMLIPGLADLPVLAPPKTFTAFLSGRIHEETHRIKQAHLGVAAFATATARANKDLNLPACLRSENNPTLKVRGLSAGTIGREDHLEAETELKRFAER